MKALLVTMLIVNIILSRCLKYGGAIMFCFALLWSTAWLASGQMTFDRASGYGITLVLGIVLAILGELLIRANERFAEYLRPKFNLGTERH